MNKYVKRDIRLNFAQLYATRTKNIEYLQGVFITLLLMGAITKATYWRYWNLIDRLKFSNEITSFRGF